MVANTAERVAINAGWLIAWDGTQHVAIEGGRLVAPAFHSVALPPQRSGPRLSQKTFRGEPDISRFD